MRSLLDWTSTSTVTVTTDHQSQGQSTWTNAMRSGSAGHTGRTTHTYHDGWSSGGASGPAGSTSSGSQTHSETGTVQLTMMFTDEQGNWQTCPSTTSWTTGNETSYTNTAGTPPATPLAPPAPGIVDALDLETLLDDLSADAAGAIQEPTTRAALVDAAVASFNEVDADANGENGGAVFGNVTEGDPPVVASGLHGYLGAVGAALGCGGPFDDYAMVDAYLMYVRTILRETGFEGVLSREGTFQSIGVVVIYVDMRDAPPGFDLELVKGNLQKILDAARLNVTVVLIPIRSAIPGVQLPKETDGVTANEAARLLGLKKGKVDIHIWGTQGGSGEAVRVCVYNHYVYFKPEGPFPGYTPNPPATVLGVAGFNQQYNAAEGRWTPTGVAPKDVVWANVVFHEVFWQGLAREVDVPWADPTGDGSNAGGTRALRVLGPEMIREIMRRLLGA